tara:strand:+ start:262 stop:411 length:150 start_codon:yes stop_codon:yes gene_type:complete
MIGLGLKIQVNQAIGEVSTLLSALQSRAVYFENASGTTQILDEFERCSI